MYRLEEGTEQITGVFYHKVKGKTQQTEKPERERIWQLYFTVQFTLVSEMELSGLGHHEAWVCSLAGLEKDSL